MTAATRFPPRFAGPAQGNDQHAGAWAADRDDRLTAFLTARMRVTETTGCRDELHALGWILTVLPAWEAARSNPGEDPLDGACIATVGWILRQVAHSRWSRHPEWMPDFHPQAIALADPTEASR